jgi:hypothetical protein
MAKRKITYYWGDRNLKISLGNRTNLRIRALYMVEFLVTASMATIFLLQSFPFKHNFIHWAACIGAGLLYMLAANRFFARIFLQEDFLLDQQSLTLIRKTLFSQQVRRFDWKEVGVLHYEGKSHKTDHPLKGGCYDYFGFETQEQLIQSLHNAGNLFFTTPKGKIHFAVGVYSWDAEEMVQMMKLYTGNALKLGPEWKEMLQEQEFDDAQ